LIPFLDLAADFAAVEADARRRIDGVLARQQFVLGPETAELEAALSGRLGATAVAVSSGTEALSLSLLALGIGAGDAVLLPAFTFFATAGAVARAGAVPVFCDIDRATFLADATTMQAALERGFVRDGSAWKHRTSGAKLAALLPVHLYGRACAMDDVVSLARGLGVAIVEDAAQAFGAQSRGRSAGTFGATGCFSFYPTKNLGGAGDGGLVACADAALAERIARLRSHGGEHGSYEHHEAGINARMAELVAAVLNAKLARVDEWTQQRRRLASTYGVALAAAAARGHVELPSPCAEREHVWHQYAVRIPGGSGRAGARRDEVMRRLADDGIATRVFYPLPLHLQPCFASLGLREGDLPASEQAAREVLCLPIHPSLSEASVLEAAERVVAAVSR
jgi:dTDP-4-amino-4,6-dideoxygalactose transaminase